MPLLLGMVDGGGEIKRGRDSCRGFAQRRKTDAPVPAFRLFLLQTHYWGLGTVATCQWVKGALIITQ